MKDRPSVRCVVDERTMAWVNPAYVTSVEAYWPAHELNACNFSIHVEGRSPIFVKTDTLAERETLLRDLGCIKEKI